MSAASTTVDTRSNAVSGGGLPVKPMLVGGLRAVGRPLVLLGCDDDEASVVRAGWVGQSLDIEHRSELGEVLYLAGRAAPDVIVVASGAGLRVVDFLRIIRRVDCGTPVIVGVPDVTTGAPAVTPEGATAVVGLPLDPLPLLEAVESSVGAGSAFRARPLALDLGRLRVDGAGPRIWIDGVQRVIPPMEFLLLRYLAERHGQIISRDELVSAAWGEPVALHSNSLSVHIARLRRRFCDSTGEAWIRPVRGFGYQLTVSRRPAARPVRRRARGACPGQQ